MQRLNRELGTDGGLDRYCLRLGIERLLVVQDAPGNSGELVRQRDGEFVLVQSLRRRFEPCAEAIAGPIVRAHQQDLRRLDQQRAQILAAPLGDAAEDRPPAGAVLSRHEPEPGGKIAPALKSLSPADRGHDTGGDYRSDPGHTHQPPALGFDLAELFDRTGDGLDALIDAESDDVKTSLPMSASDTWLDSIFACMLLLLLLAR